MKVKQIAIILTVHNRKQTTLTCLDKIYDMALYDDFVFSVYLTDDGSTDGTSQVVKEKFHKVHIIKGDGNLYWNRGMRLAWEAARKDNDFDYYLWLNDDTLVWGCLLLEMLSLSTIKNDKAIIVGATVDSKTKMEHTYGGRKNNVLVPLDGHPHKVETFNGNIVLVPKLVFKSLGYNDYVFQHSLGDLDYGLRAKKNGIECWQTGTAVGECDRHREIMVWCNPNIPFKKRWKKLFEPTGYPPKEVWIFNERHYGIVVALKRLVLSFARCMFPNIWIKANKANWI